MQLSIVARMLSQPPAAKSSAMQATTKVSALAHQLPDPSGTVVLDHDVPFGVRSQHETGDIVAGTDPGAPVAPRLLAKALWTTFISAVIFAGVAVFAALSG